jgi:membrane protein DedA with SNARE-associated domain
MIAATLQAIATAASGQPFLLFLAIMLFTFLLEDAVALACGLLASQMLIDPVLALSALLVGTIAGDLGLYAIGRYAADTRLGHRLGSVRGVASARRWLKRRSLLVVAAARFVPGLRLPVYLASGYCELAFGRFAAVVVASCLVWTPAIFLIAFRAGSESRDIVEGATLVGLALVALLASGALLPRLLFGDRNGGHPAC